MGWGETEAIIGKAPGLGIHTRVMQTPSRVSVKLWEEYFATVLSSVLTCRVECVSVWWRVVACKGVVWVEGEVEGLGSAYKN